MSLLSKFESGAYAELDFGAGVNWKNILQEHCQKNGCEPPKYIVVSTPDNRWQCTSVLFPPDTSYPATDTLLFNSSKAASQHTARAVCYQVIRGETPVSAFDRLATTIGTIDWKDDPSNTETRRKAHVLANGKWYASECAQKNSDDAFESACIVALRAVGERNVAKAPATDIHRLPPMVAGSHRLPAISDETRERVFRALTKKTAESYTVDRLITEELPDLSRYDINRALDDLLRVQRVDYHFNTETWRPADTGGRLGVFVGLEECDHACGYSYHVRFDFTSKTTRDALYFALGAGVPKSPVYFLFPESDLPAFGHDLLRRRHLKYFFVTTKRELDIILA